MKFSELKKEVRAIPDEDVLNYLADHQDQWTCLWNRYFEGKDDTVTDVAYAMPKDVSGPAALLKMKRLYAKKYVGGCNCGCRGDFVITDLGLAKINRARTHEYCGY